MSNKYLHEHEQPYTPMTAMEEASRCLLCDDAPCDKGCPAGTNPSKFIRSIRFDNIKGAIQTIREANIAGGICSRVCPYKNLCEKDCSRAKIDRPIDIGKLQRFATDYEAANKITVLVKPKPSRENVAIIGSGPAGLAAASRLAMMGYKVTVFEKDSVPGGVLTYGIIPSRLPQDVVNHEVNYVKQLGVEFRTKTELGRNLFVKDLEKEGFKSILIALGNKKPKRMGIPGSDLQGVRTAVDFLAEAKSTEGKVAAGKIVVVIGGGDVAMDSASTAKLLGAEKVIILYRRRLEDMPASENELYYVRSLNVDIFTTFTPEEFIGENGRVKAVRAKSVQHDSSITLQADLVIEAIGQEAEDIQNVIPLDVNEKKAITVLDRTGRTNIRGIFAAGDIVNGGETVVEAVRAGKDAADGINEYLCGLRNEKPKLFSITRPADKSLEMDFCGVRCENPFFLSSSPVGHSYEMCAKALNSGWGGIVYKTIVKFVCDECSPRFDSNRKEVTPFIGFKNMEQLSEKSYEEDLEVISRLKKDFPEKIMVSSIMGQNDDEWTELAMLSTQAGADMIECNFSCPQVARHGLGSDVGQNPDLVRQYSAAVKKGTKLPVIAKMTPNIGNMEIPGMAAIEGGADSLAAINTIKSMTAIDLDKFVCLPIVNGKSSISGYSGKAVKPIALRFVAQLAQHPKLAGIPISGIGGIETWRDAVEFITVGASNLQVTTAIMQYGYRIVEDLISGTRFYLKDKGISRLEQLVGAALGNIIPAENLDRDFLILPEIDNDKCVGCARCYVSCYDGAHQAIDWDREKRRPSINDKCVGCHLCLNVCPATCIKPGKIKFKPGRKEHDVKL